MSMYFEVENQIETDNNHLTLLGINDIYETVHFAGDTYEVSVSNIKERTTKWFNSFEEAHQHIMELVPNADWEEIGWR